MKKKGSKLIFISRIKRDGSGVEQVSERLKFRDNEKFKLNRLSISEGTYIASGMNSFVVKIKEI